MSFSLKEKAESCQKGFLKFMRQPLSTIDFHINSGINQARFYWNSKFTVFMIVFLT